MVHITAGAQLTSQGLARARGRSIALLLTYGAVLSALAVHNEWGRDFASFYASAVSLARGSDPYTVITPGAATNINLPHVIVVSRPLAALPFDAAFALWQVLQLTAWGALFILLPRNDQSSWSPEFVAAAALYPGTLAQIAQGQWGFLLALLVMLAFRSQLASREITAGVWIGIVTALKPFAAVLIVMYVRQRRWKGALAAALVVAGCAAAGVLFLGAGMYERWFHAAASIDWAAYPSNASLRGFAERTLAPPFAGWFWIGGAVLVLAVTLLMTGVRSHEPGSWVAWLSAALLASPLGWLYYTWMLAPALLALPRWTLPVRTGLVFLFVPPGVLPALSTATIGLALVWAGTLIEVRSRQPLVQF